MGYHTNRPTKICCSPVSMLETAASSRSLSEFLNKFKCKNCHVSHGRVLREQQNNRNWFLRLFDAKPPKACNIKIETQFHRLGFSNPSMVEIKYKVLDKEFLPFAHFFVEWHKLHEGS